MCKCTRNIWRNCSFLIRSLNKSLFDSPDTAQSIFCGKSFHFSSSCEKDFFSWGLILIICSIKIRCWCSRIRSLHLSSWWKFVCMYIVVFLLSCVTGTEEENSYSAWCKEQIKCSEKKEVGVSKLHGWTPTLRTLILKEAVISVSCCSDMSLCMYFVTQNKYKNILFFCRKVAWTWLIKSILFHQQEGLSDTVIL